MSTYNEILERIFSLPSAELKIGLSNTQTLSESIGSPQNGYKCIHVAGTNGKGSVTTKIAEALTLSGYKTGMFTSPHISSYRERICIDNEMISEDDVVEGMEYLFKEQQLLSLNLSFFELSTLLAFWYFAKKNVDFAVFETGLGGRLDATNVIDPVLTVITSISLDHEKILGKTLEAIGSQKAGIIKPLVPLVLGPEARLDVIYDRAKSLGSTVIDVDIVEGFYDLQNQLIAKITLKEIAKTYQVSKKAIEKGVLKRPICRFEVFDGHNSLFKKFSHKPKVLILDVGHNAQALRKLAVVIKEKYPSSRCRVVMGLSIDKDTDLCAKIVSSFANYVYVVTSVNKRAQDLQELHSSFFRNGFQNVEISDSISSGMSKALTSSSEEDVILICGSFYIMPEARSFLGIEESKDQIF